MRLHPVRRVLVGAAVALPLAVVVAGPASAHVVVFSPDATPGGFGTLAFRVPSESASATTVKITVTLPADAPFGDVSAQVHPGWRVTTTQRKLTKPVTTDDGFTLDKAVGTVTWTATAGGIPAGQFDDFDLSVGPFPSQAGRKLTFTAVQTYSDGSVVTWNQPTVAGKAEPEHPAPTLTVGAAPGTAAIATSAAAPTAPTGSAASASDGTARWIALAAIALAVAAVGVASAALTRGRRS